MTIFLIGPRASGKTAVGQRLAEALGLTFVDTDQYMLERGGMSVTEVVEREGWAGFRRRESEALRAVALPGRVVATGGGMVLACENREFMRENGVVLYLSAPVEVLVKRLSADPDHAGRPSLTGKTIGEEMAEILALREPLYRETAHHVVNAERELDEVAVDAANRINRETLR